MPVRPCLICPKILNLDLSSGSSYVGILGAVVIFYLTYTNLRQLESLEFQQIESLMSEISHIGLRYLQAKGKKTSKLSL